MNPKDKQPEYAHLYETQIDTPPPPQVLDPSKPPGQGAHETYRKSEQAESDRREVAESNSQRKQ